MSVCVCLHMSTCACVRACMRACMHACMCMYLHAFGNNFKYAIDYIQDLCNDIFEQQKFPHCKILSIIKKKVDGKWEKLNYDRSSVIDHWNWMSIQLVRTADWPVTFPMAASAYSSWSVMERLVKVSGRLVPRAVMVIDPCEWCLQPNHTTRGITSNYLTFHDTYKRLLWYTCARKF